MIRRLHRFRADDRGLAALEFALVAPIFLAVLLIGADHWLRISQLSAMRSALQTGVRYFQTGGVDDAKAQALANQAWTRRPPDGVVVVARTCACGAVTVECTNLCSADPPSVFITLTATGQFAGLTQSRTLTQSDVLRVR